MPVLPEALFTALSPLLTQIPLHPDLAALDRLCAASQIKTASGKCLRFVPPDDEVLGYETRVWERGEVVTRPDSWHDFFNALVWLSFPRAKSTLNARHVQALASRAGDCAEMRGAERDALTHFDECGVFLVSSDPELLDLVRTFRWKTLFWERRADLAHRLRCFVFGHATYERLLAPFRGLTAKAVLCEVGEDWWQVSPAAQLADIDQRLAEMFAIGRVTHPQVLHPLPLMGFPGMTPANERAEYYDDTWQFRSGRMRTMAHADI